MDKTWNDIESETFKIDFVLHQSFQNLDNKYIFFLHL